MRSIARLRAVVSSQAPGVLGRAVAWPALRRDRERLLGGFLGEVEVAEEADQRSEDAAPLIPEDPLDQRSTTGRTSIAPPMPRSRDAGGQLDRSVEVAGLEQVVATERLLGLDERPVGRQRPAILHADRRRRGRRLKLCPGR